MLRRYTPLRRFSLKPRRGRIEDSKYLAWIRTLGCMVRDAECCPAAFWRGAQCSRWVESHHVGRPRNDRRAVPLCAAHYRNGPEAVHWIGRRAFESRFAVSFEAAIAGLNDEYEMTKGRRIA